MLNWLDALIKIELLYFYFNNDKDIVQYSTVVFVFDGHLRFSLFFN
jgi:hypothetical protein